MNQNNSPTRIIPTMAVLDSAPLRRVNNTIRSENFPRSVFCSRTLGILPYLFHVSYETNVALPD